MCDGHEHRPRPSPRSAWQNLSAGDMPLPRRLQRIAVNSWLKARHRQSCCGNHGEPGC
ncbi:MAG TPA: hypothetical protein VIC57_13635 [Candidatus Dormibacteraeota bacterium]|jgi:hypothetical protein